MIISRIIDILVWVQNILWIFSLLHKEFGINNMYSMEINSAKKTRKDLNLISLFNCIKMLFEMQVIFSTAEYTMETRKNIIWLDYDGGINSNQIQDVESCISKVESGSVVFVSFNSDLGTNLKRHSKRKVGHVLL